VKRRATTDRKSAKARRGNTTKRKRSGGLTAARRPRVSVADLQAQIQLQEAELEKARQEQAAISEVLRIIGSSHGELEPVFQSIMKNATRLCEAKFGELDLFDGKAFRWAAQVGTPRQLIEFQQGRGSFQPLAGGLMDRVVRTKQAHHTAEDSAAPVPMPAATHGGARSTVSVPVLRDEDLIGVIHIYRQEVRPFTKKQIQLVQNFAAQAVIAIENARLLNELRQRTADLTESVEQQTATSEVLKVISSSPGELEPVFQAMLKSATRICEAKFGTLYSRESDGFRAVAMHGAPSAYVAARLQKLVHPGSHNTGIARAAATKQPVQVEDAAADGGYAAGDPTRIAAVDLGGVRTLLDVPMLKDNEVIGIIAIYREVVRPFTEKQIALVQNFAAQAVIAIENARVLNELRQRTTDLAESLEQQTATSRVLEVISSSPGMLEPVFQSMLQNATRICGAKFGMMWLSEGQGFRSVALHGVPQTLATERIGRHVNFDADTPLGKLAGTKQVVQVADITREQGYKAGFRPLVELADLGGARTLLLVPMVKDNALVGALAIYRQEIRPFTEKQVDLLKNFAAQAVIAVENARLLNELHERTADLSESLEQQTATSKVLEVINRSAFDLKAVFETVAESSVRLCGADRAFIFRYDGELLRMAVAHNSSPEFTTWVQEHPIRPGRHSGSARAALERRTIHIPDVQADPEYTYGAKDAEAIRTILGVPILKGDELLGVMMIYRLEVRPFAEKQIELVETFADQAAIAIENVRLFDEIQDKSRQLEIASKHKSQFLANMSHELRTPLNAILGYTELILDNIYGETPTRMRTVLVRVQTNGKHLLGLINDVLDLSKIEAGQLTLSLNDYSIHDMVQAVYTAVEPLASGKKLALTIAVPGDLPPAHGDDRRLSQVLLNLVGNAIKFTDAGEVAVTAAAAKGAYTISVRDTGPGIATEDQSKIFEEFQQADNSQTKAKGGTGLGLAIAKRIVEMHGGTLWVESSPGRGATFSFTVPLRVEGEMERI
jgi:signal transduction histidine kinase